MVSVRLVQAMVQAIMYVPLFESVLKELVGLPTDDLRRQVALQLPIRLVPAPEEVE